MSRLVEEALQHDIAELREHLADLRKRYEDGAITEEVYDETSWQLENELYHLEDQLDFMRNLERQYDERADWELRQRKEDSNG